MNDENQSDISYSRDANNRRDNNNVGNIRNRRDVNNSRTPTTAETPTAEGYTINGGNQHFQVAEFLSAEAMGVDSPRRCASCKNCKECQFRTSAITFKEVQEYQAILDGLKFDKNRKKWTVNYIAMV
jgi:hypothetical protein